MMKMMDRLVEGRGHRREIDMLLELTYVLSINQFFFWLMHNYHIRKQVQNAIP